MRTNQKAVNTEFIENAVLDIISLIFCLICFHAESNGTGIFFAVGFAAILIGTLAVKPYCYVFDADGVALCYAFGRKEVYLWNDIRSIDLRYKTGYYGNVHLFSRYIYEIYGNIEEKEKWYMQRYITKNFHTKTLIEKYWGIVEESDFTKLKNKIRKHREKTQRQIDAHFTDEIVKAEREVRARIRKSAKPYIEKAKEHKLHIGLKFYYITENGDELTSRPEEWYAYTAYAEISYMGEEDEDKKVFADEELLYVRINKKGYKFTEVKGFEDSFKAVLEDSLPVIIEKGIEFYCD